MNIDGQSAIITGGGSGLGAATSAALMAVSRRSWAACASASVISEATARASPFTSLTD